MAGGIDWFRWHHGSVNDQKFGLVAKKAGASVAEVIAVWACLLEAASTSSDRGNPGVLDFEAMDYALGLDEGKAQAIYSRMQERAMIEASTGRVASWEKRQPKREREDDSSTERSRKHRATQRHATPETIDATPCNAMQRQETPGNAMQRQETPRGEERREEEIRTKPKVLASGVPNSPPATSAGRVCARLRQAGIASVNPSNPKLHALLDAGMSEDELADLAEESGSRGKGFAWLLAAAEGRRRDASAIRPLPRASPNALSDKNRAAAEAAKQMIFGQEAQRATG